jgi:hypothetical protein
MDVLPSPMCDMKDFTPYIASQQGLLSNLPTDNVIGYLDV